MLHLATRVVRDSRPTKRDLRGARCGRWVAMRPTTKRAADGGVVWQVYDHKTRWFALVPTGRLRKARKG
jgi:hypothetical protein